MGPAIAGGDGTGSGNAIPGGTAGGAPPSLGGSSPSDSGSSGGLGGGSGQPGPGQGPSTPSSGGPIPGSAGEVGPPAGDPLGSAVGDASSGGSVDGADALLQAGLLGFLAHDPFGQLPRLATLAALVSTTTTLALAFLLFGKKRRDEAPTESDAALAAAAASPYAMLGSELVPAYAGVDPGTGGTDINLPRWRRPSLLAARKSDPIRNGVEHVNLTFGLPGASTACGERQVVRYRLVRLLDRPDELLGQAVDSLDEGDEVEILEQRGTYRRVATPDGREGWLHRMTLGEIVSDAPPSTFVSDEVTDDVLLAYLTARARA